MPPAAGQRLVPVLAAWLPLSPLTLGHKALAPPLGPHSLDVLLLCELTQRQRGSQPAVPLLHGQQGGSSLTLQVAAGSDAEQDAAVALGIPQVPACLPGRPGRQAWRQLAAPLVLVPARSLTCTWALGGRPLCAAWAWIGTTPTDSAISLAGEAARHGSCQAGWHAMAGKLQWMCGPASARLGHNADSRGSRKPVGKHAAALTAPAWSVPARRGPTQASWQSGKGG